MDTLRSVGLDRVKERDREKGYLGSRPIQYPEEELVAWALVELGYEWQYETVMLREYGVDEKGNAIIRGAASDFFLPALDIFLEVKLRSNPDRQRSGRARSNKGRQRRLALQAGYGFAIVFRLHYDEVVLRRKVRAAVEQAVQIRRWARHEFPDWERQRQLQQVIYNCLLIPEPRAVAI